MQEGTTVQGCTHAQTCARVQVSKVVRFEIFKRDGFRCVYCSAGPTEEPLHVDHVHPVALGGDNRPENLVTSCRSCNLGKGARPLSERRLPTGRREDVEEHRDQLLGYLAAQRELVDAGDRVVDHARDRWVSETGFRLSLDEDRSLRRFVKRLGLAVVCTLIDEAAARNADAPFRYFASLCWNHIRSAESEGGA